MGSPRPSYGRVKNYTTHGRFEYGCLGGSRLGLNNINSYTPPYEWGTKLVELLL